MIVIVYGIILIVYWWSSTRITSEKYPHANADLVMQWRYRRLRNCRRYAALLVIYILLAIGAGYSAGYSMKHSYHTLFYISIAIPSIYLLASLIYILINAINTYRFAKESGIYGSRHQNK